MSRQFSGPLLAKYYYPELYHHDGQIYDEDYVYGSFLQSKMAEKGVSCTNCHDPHNAKLKIPEETVCAQCHSPQEYSSDKHFPLTQQRGIKVHNVSHAGNDLYAS
ncbi:cytochrome c3 family protein [Vibrio sp. SCSIO 43186]|uniref:cytochrome c3 family protein n=1 Tax=Vibrio sp. SCSIO 43186 TaxID=2822843 RepID=UPI0020754035|nr:cytochrome c3 family protein [Vibrio sp. SCSIO 43186]